jgi:hypothetical protein
MVEKLDNNKNKSFSGLRIVVVVVEEEELRLGIRKTADT